MQEEIKNSLYSLLDLIDALNSVEFLKVDLEKSNKIRDVILSAISENTQSSKMPATQTGSDDIFIHIYTFLSSKKRFKKKNDLIEYASEHLKIKSANKWSGKTINDIIGNIIIEIMTAKNHEMLITLTKDIRDTKDNEKSKKSSKNKKSSSKSSSTFMDTWFNFFDNYEG